MIKNFKLVSLTLLVSSIGVAQVPSQYQEQLDMLPESVRSSVFERINENDFSQEENQRSILKENEENEENEEDKDKDDLIKFDLLQKDYDRYGSLIPKPFGYDLFQNYRGNNFTSVQSAPADYILGPGDELRIITYGDNSFEQNVIVDRNGNINIRGYGLFFASGNPPENCNNSESPSSSFNS